MKKRIIAGFNVTCVGDDRCYSYLPSRNGKTLSDKVALHVLKHTDPEFKRYTWLDRGGDERQYCAPGIDLPLCTFSRSKFNEYPEYHTSADNFNLVTEKGLKQSLKIFENIINCFEIGLFPKNNILCEPQLGKRNLYPSLGIKSVKKSSLLNNNLLDFNLAFSVCIMTAFCLYSFLDSLLVSIS